jgi:hypothetical protein
MLVPITLTEGEDGETRRRFFLLAEVSFAASDRSGGGYYSDTELTDQFGEWVNAALDDRDDSPRARFHTVPAPLDTDVAAIAAGTYPGNADALVHLRTHAEDVERLHRVDDEAAHGREDALLRTALEMIRDGAGDPAALAAVALSTSRLTFERNCA